MATKPQGRVLKRYRLKGPYSGQDRVLCGLVFRGGEAEANLNEKEHESLSKVLAFYQGEEVKDDGKRDVQADETGDVVGEVRPAGESSASGAAHAGNAGAAGSAAPGDQGRRLGTDGDGQAEGVGRLRQVLLALDSSVDSNWTAAGRPAIQAVEKAMGRPVTRAQIEAALPGFTREESE